MDPMAYKFSSEQLASFWAETWQKMSEQDNIVVDDVLFDAYKFERNAGNKTINERLAWLKDFLFSSLKQGSDQ